ncbi:ABC transporter permease subunit [Nonomuraea sp. SYSU D8015]|uniref:ABC transporter permease subunit n=1 Tax=Nonomuraea sp. SYSU D8015 TaxID=2593644 RepID=UPI001CB6BF50|nr:hypothetical protein [Nonomuraea sp. SYSU D8015]
MLRWSALSALAAVTPVTAGRVNPNAGGAQPSGTTPATATAASSGPKRIGFFGFAKANSFAARRAPGSRSTPRANNATAEFLDPDFDAQAQVQQLQDAVTAKRFDVHRHAGAQHRAPRPGPGDHRRRHRLPGPARLESFQSLSRPTVLGGVTGSSLLVVAVAVVTSVVLARTTFGRHVYAVGGDPTASWLPGIGVPSVRVGVFAISGICAAPAGLVPARGAARPSRTWARCWR